MARHGTTRGVGSRMAKTYNSFTLHSPPAQCQPGDLPDSPGTRAPRPLRIVIRTLTLQRALRFGLLLIALVMVSSVGSKPATAMAKAKSCADQVIADWYDDGRVGKIYPLHCYTEAIAKLPPDVLDYSNAKEEIGRALAFAKQGKPDPGGSDPSPGSTGTTETTTSRARAPRRRRPHDTTETTTTDADDGRHRHDLDGRASDGHLRAVLGAGAAARPRWPCGAAPRSRLRRLPAPPDERWRRR